MTVRLPTLIALFVLALSAGCSRRERTERTEGPASAEEEASADPGDDPDDTLEEPAGDGEADAEPDDSEDAPTASDATPDAQTPDTAGDAPPDAGEAGKDALEDAASAVDAAVDGAAQRDAVVLPDTDAQSAVEAGGSDAARGEDGAAPDPTCGNDDELLEPNGSFASLILLGATNFNTTSYYALNSCVGDIDHLLIGHLGGTLSVTVTGEVDLQVLPATVDEAATRASYLTGDRRVIVSGSGAALTSSENVPAGFYLLRVTGRTRARAIYSLNITHGCEGDGFDTPGIVDTASFATVLTPRLVTRFNQPYSEAPAAERAKLCAGDVDAFQFRARKSGDAVIELGNATNIRATVTQLSAAGVEGTVARVEERSSGGTRSVRVLGVDPSVTYVVRVAEVSPSPSALSYTFLVRFEYDVSTNDVCSTAQQLAVAEAVTTLESDNIGTRSDVTSVCNGDAEMTDPTLLGRDVFFWFHLAAPSSVSFDLEPIDESNAGDSFSGSATVYAAPGGVCPSTFDQLLPLAYDGRQAQDAQQIACVNGHLRISDVPAGDYLLVVDGSTGYTVHGSASQPAQGRFRLHTQAFAQDFPVPQACREATEITLPARGGSSSFRVSPGVEAPEAFVDYGACALHQSIHGGERALTFTATRSATLVIRSEGTLGSVEAPFFDSVLAVAQGACRFVHPPELVACVDDTSQSLNSELTLSVRAGERYFLLVDHWHSPGAPLPAPTIVTFSVQ